MKSDETLSGQALLKMVSSARVRLGALRLSLPNNAPGLAEQMDAGYADLVALAHHIPDEAAARDLARDTWKQSGCFVGSIGSRRSR